MLSTMIRFNKLYGKVEVNVITGGGLIMDIDRLWEVSVAKGIYHPV